MLELNEIKTIIDRLVKQDRVCNSCRQIILDSLTTYYHDEMDKMADNYSQDTKDALKIAEKILEELRG